MLRRLLLAPALATLVGCAGRQTTPTAPLPPGACARAPITYYADDLAGKPTASGEPYEPGKMTAAHRSLPLGTRLRVRWEGREARVRVNDRGGPRGGVDLSRAAAEQLGMIRAGRVNAEVCREGGR